MASSMTRCCCQSKTSRSMLAMTACLLAPRSSIICGDERAHAGAVAATGTSGSPFGKTRCATGSVRNGPEIWSSSSQRVALADLLADALRSHSATSSGTPCASGTHRATANGKTSSRTFS